VATFLVIVQSLSKLTCMFQKTLGDLAESSGEILKPLSSFDDPSLARVSVVTMVRKFYLYFKSISFNKIYVFAGIFISSYLQQRNV